MFVRVKKSADKLSASIQIVQNQRVDNTTKQSVLRHVGTAHTDEEIEQLKRIGETIKNELENKITELQTKKLNTKFASVVGNVNALTKDRMVDITQLQERARRIFGIHDTYGYIYDRLGFTNLFSRPKQRENSATVLRDIVLSRIAYPVSKRASIDWLFEKCGIELNLDHVYQMMDKIDNTFIERLKKRTLSETLKLTGEKLRVLFYDCTTLYFESFSEDELKQNGYSKDLKFNQPQILLVLFVTEKGLPIGYELFPGSTFEGHTLITALENLKKQYDLKDVVFVADRGLFSEDNLKLLEEKKFKYIVGARIKNMSKKMQTDIFNIDNYKSIQSRIHNINKKNKEKKIEQRVASFSCEKERKLVVHYSNKRAKKDEYDRNKAIEKLRKKISKSKDPKSLLSSYGYKKFLGIKGSAEIVVQENKIQDAAKWDGLVGVITNDKEATPEQLFSHYRGLWQIEESFRINKHDLKMRPIYHWQPQRVKAHIAICFMSFVCVRYLEFLAHAQIQKISPEVIRHALMNVQGSIIEDKKTSRKFLLTSEMPSYAKEIYRILNIKIPASVSEIK
jgi:transposase